MGARKRNRADQLKKERENVAFAVLRNCPTSPRKMRLVADLVRGMDVMEALDILRYNQKEASNKIEKLLKSAIENWRNKNEGVRMEDAELFIKEIFVDQSSTLKRIQPAPQGRAHRIRKRSNHVTIILGSRNVDAMQNENVAEVETVEQDNNETK